MTGRDTSRAPDNLEAFSPAPAGLFHARTFPPLQIVRTSIGGRDRGRGCGCDCVRSWSVFRGRAELSARGDLEQAADLGTGQACKLPTLARVAHAQRTRRRRHGGGPHAYAYAAVGLLIYDPARSQ